MRKPRHVYLAEAGPITLYYRFNLTKEGYNNLIARMKQSYLHLMYKPGLEEFLKVFVKPHLPPYWNCRITLGGIVYITITRNTRNMTQINRELRKLTTRLNRLCLPIKDSRINPSMIQTR